MQQNIAFTTQIEELFPLVFDSVLGFDGMLSLTVSSVWVGF